MSNPKVQMYSEMLEFSRQETLRAAGALSEKARLFQPAEGRPTPLWLIGHLGNSANNVIVRWCLQGENVFPKDQAKRFAPDFAMGEPPSTDASKYPPFEEVVKLYDEAMTKTIAMVKEKLTDADLEKPLPANIPDPIRTFFPSIGAALMRMVGHDSYHRGQMALLGKIAG